MTWYKTEADHRLFRLFAGLLLFLIAGAQINAVENPVPLSQPRFLTATAIFDGPEVEVGGQVVAPPGSVVVIIGVPGREDVELEVQPGGGFLESFPVDPGSSGSMEVRLVLPTGVIADSRIVHFN